MHSCIDVDSCLNFEHTTNYCWTCRVGVVRIVWTVLHSDFFLFFNLHVVVFLQWHLSYSYVHHLLAYSESHVMHTDLVLFVNVAYCGLLGVCCDINVLNKNATNCYIIFWDSCQCIRLIDVTKRNAKYYLLRAVTVRNHIALPLFVW